MRRLVALAAAAALLAAVPLAEAAKPLRFAGGKRPACAVAKKKQRTACRKRARARGWKARERRADLLPPAPAPPPGTVPAAETGTVPAAAAPAQNASNPADSVEPGTVPGSGEGTDPGVACDPSPWVGAIAEDVDGFRLRLTRTCVPEGTVLFQFRNEDLAFHNLWAEGTEPVRAAREVVGDTPGETMVTASEQMAAGEWRLYCSLPGHEAMTRPVTVTPAG